MDNKIVSLLEYIIHGIFALVLVYILQDKYPIILAIFLYGIVAYLSYTQTTFPKYTLTLVGLSITAIAYLLNHNFIIWRAPFWSIYAYYLLTMVIQPPLIE